MSTADQFPETEKEYAAKSAGVCVGERAPVDGIDAPQSRVDTQHHSYKEEDLTALQKHCAFFDRDHDGYISPMDTYKGLRALGFNILVSAWFTCVINGALAPPTADGWYPTIYINLKNVHRSKHGSDSGIYDENGRFHPAHFDAFFDKYDLDRDGQLSWSEWWNRAKAQRVVFDPFGWFATLLEFGFTFILLAKDGKIPKEQLKGVYDGTIFEKTEADLKAKKEAKKQAKLEAKANKNKKKE